MSLDAFVDANPTTPTPTPGSNMTAAWGNKVEDLRFLFEDAVNASRYGSGTRNAAALNAALDYMAANAFGRSFPFPFFIPSGTWAINAAVDFSRAYCFPIFAVGAQLVQADDGPGAGTIVMPPDFLAMGIGAEGQLFTPLADIVDFVSFPNGMSQLAQAKWFGVDSAKLFGLPSFVFAEDATGFGSGSIGVASTGAFFRFNPSVIPLGGAIRFEVTTRKPDEAIDGSVYHQFGIPNPGGLDGIGAVPLGLRTGTEFRDQFHTFILRKVSATDWKYEGVALVDGSALVPLYDPNYTQTAVPFTPTLEGGLLKSYFKVVNNTNSTGGAVQITRVRMLYDPPALMALTAT